MKKIILFSMISLMALSAEARRDQVREARQEERIAGGVRSGALTGPEARRLHRGQRRVDMAQRKAMADGVVTPEEKARLEKMQDVQSKRIFSQKHDAQERPEITANTGE